jgi:hypothetical protein
MAKPPGGVKRSSRDQAFNKVAVSIEHIDIPISSSRNIATLCAILQGVGNVEITADVLDIEIRINFDLKQVKGMVTS